MKLLDSTKKAVAVLDEGTTKLCYYGKDPALIYFTATKTAKFCVVKKVKGLAGWFIETDAGNVVALTGSLENMIDILETVLGTKIGYFESTGAGNPLPEKTVDFYKEKDEDDSEIITITVIVDGEDEPRVLEFTRGPNAVKVKDVIAKLEDIEGLTGLADAEGNVLGKKNKLLEDQELTAVIEKELEAIIIDGEAEVKVGETITLTANAENVIWETDNDEVATVEDGVVTGVAPGEVIVTASADGFNPGTKVITVKEASAEGDGGQGEGGEGNNTPDPDPNTDPTGNGVEGNETDSDNV